MARISDRKSNLTGVSFFIAEKQGKTGVPNYPSNHPQHRRPTRRNMTYLPRRASRPGTARQGLGRRALFAYATAMRPIPRLLLAPIAIALAALTLTGPTIAKPAKKAPAPAAGIVRVRMVTADGPIILALDTRRAPVTSANFLSYVDDGRFDGAVIYRSARSRNAQQYGFIQGGIRTDARRILPPFKHERTDQTGLHHIDGTISMARRTEPNSAGGNFFITVGALPSFDAKGDFPGYAAFGHVVGGMDTVKRILAQPTGGSMRGQMLLKPIKVINARRLNGPAKPTGLVKPWLVKQKR